MATEKEPKDLLEWLGFSAKPNWKVARPLGYLMGIATILLFALAILSAFSSLLQTLIAPTSAGLGAGTLIVALLGAPFLIWRTIIAHKTLGFQKEGHITDRISKAVEQLGAEKTVKKQLVYPNGNKAFEFDEVIGENLSRPIYVEETAPNIEVRIGALLSLERIAQDSSNYDNGRDHVRIMEILCAYVRENFPLQTAINYPKGAWASSNFLSFKSAAQREEYYTQRSRWFGVLGANDIDDWKKTLPKPREDLAIALKVIGRRSSKQMSFENREEFNNAKEKDNVAKPVFPNFTFSVSPNNLNDFLERVLKFRRSADSRKMYRIDLNSTNLQSVNISGLNFANAIFSFARMEGAVGISTNFCDAKLDRTNLTGVVFADSDFTSAYFNEAICQQALFSNSCFQGSVMAGSQLQGSWFGNANLTAATARDSSFECASLSNANLIAINFDGANLNKTSFFAADARFARFIDVSFDNHSDFYDTKLGFALLHNFKLPKDILSNDQLNEAYGDNTVLLSNSASRPKDWSVENLLQYSTLTNSYENWLSKKSELNELVN